MKNNYLNILTIFTFLHFISVINLAFAQNNTAWDNTSKSKWNEAFKIVEIPSSADTMMQKAYFYKTKGKNPAPLIISLHTWSGNYAQKDPIAQEVLDKDWNYIHPDFRGPNNTPNAMGSPLVIADIKDAVLYAIDQGNVNKDEIHIIGVSGGGYATLLSYMQLDIPIKSFTAWVPISDIDAWYWESVGRKSNYAKNILSVISNNGIYNKTEAIKRSPLHQKYNRELRKGSSLSIYAGIHDGYTGSVPITHSLHMYNKIVAELKYKTSDQKKISELAKKDSDLIADQMILELVTKRIIPNQAPSLLLNKTSHYYKQFQNICINIFEGGHEQLPKSLSLISSMK